MRKSIPGFVLTLLLLGCGGGASQPLVLMDGEVTGSYAGTPFNLLHGYVIESEGGPAVIVLAEAEVFCAAPEEETEAEGFSAVIVKSFYGIGYTTPPTVQLANNTAGAESFVNLEAGTLAVYEAGADSLTGEITLTHTDESGAKYELNGFFKVKKCK